MGRIKTIAGVSTAVLTLCLAATAEAQVATADAQVANGGDIVVTASKREQRLRDVPSAISVLSGTDLASQGVQSVRDYATLTPGLGLKDNGYPGQGTIFIRGLTTGTGQQSSTSVFYLDDVAFTSSSPANGASFLAPDPELVDIDRVEVLKGPQGTLYGASSLGGVIRLISKRPDPSRFSGNARTELTDIDGGGTGYTLRAAVNVPLIADQLAIRATGFYRRAPGYVDNVGTGSKNVNRSISKGGRLALGWTPTDRLTVDIVGQIQDINTRGPAFQSNVSGTLTPIYGARKYSAYFDAPSRIRYRLASITGNYDVGPGRLIASASYLESRLHFERDGTPDYGAFLPLLGYPAGTGIAITSEIPLKKTTAELRFVSNRLGPIEFIVGGFYTHERVVAPNRVTTRNMLDNSLLPAPLDQFVSADVADVYDEASVFGNATFYLTDQFDITGGLRFSHYKEDNTITYGGLLYGFQTVQLDNLTKNDVTSYLATVRWRPTTTLSLFARAASGYRPGGPQSAPNPPPGVPTKIDPDTVWNYEAGFKGSFLDHKLSIEASAFHIAWKNIQLTSSFGNFQFLANAGRAEVDGFELEMAARPSPLLTIGANLGYTDARIASVDAGVTATIGAAKGDPMPLTPRWTGSVTLDQLIPLGTDLDGQLGATLRYQSHMFNAYPASTFDTNTRLSAITTLDLRAGLRVRGYQVQLRVENIFDRNGVTNITSSAGLPALSTVTRPRSFILSLSTDF